MNFADHFNQALRRYENVYRLPSMANSIVLMEKTKVEVENKLKDVDMGEPNPELVRLTIRKFFDWAKNPAISFNWLEVALICRGLLIEIPGFGSLMKSESAVTLLLTKFAKKYHSQILSPYPWQGLLNAYLNCSSRDNEIEIRNREELRKFLFTSLHDVLNYSGFKPRWLEAISKHNIILAGNATRILAEEALQGSMERVETIAHEVNIPSTSWFWPELLMSQVNVMTAYPEERFKQSINHVLPLLEQREECLDDGLAKILDRYAGCDKREVHQNLKSTAVARWKSPSLVRQRGWERVSLKAKEMVGKWLVIEDLKDFFLRLRKASDNDSLDRRRFEFWMQYIDQIDYSHLILGPDTRRNFRQLLAGKIGRYSHLTGSTPTNNAFLIRMGKHYIVEFGGVGKTWAYDETMIRPLLQYGSINYQELRSKSRSAFKTYYENEEGGLAHRGAWEQKFHRALEHIGIRPDAMDLLMFLSRYELKLEKTQSSGTLWVRHLFYEGAIANFLRDQGFTFKSFTEGFYLNPRSSARY